MIAATEPVGVSQVFPRPQMETLFNDRYFVTGSGSFAQTATSFFPLI